MIIIKAIKTGVRATQKEYRRLSFKKGFDLMAHNLDAENYPDFDSFEELGASRPLGITTKGFRKNPIFKRAKKELEEQLKKSIPPAFRKNVIWLIVEPKATDYDPLGQRGSIGWKYKPY